MAILDQVGVNKSEAMKALGARRWITAITDITNSDGVKYFVKGMFNNCMFVSIRREADGMKEWQEPKLGLLVQKNEQISGYPANDGKQINILTGQCSCRCKCPCSACHILLDNMNELPEWIQRRVQESWLHKMRREDDENLGKKCARVPLVKLPLKQRWTRYCQKIRKVTDLTSVFPDAALRVGDKRIDRTAAEFQKKKKAELTNAEYMELSKCYE